MLRKIYKIAIVLYTVALLYLMFFGFGRTVMNENIVRLQPFYSTFKFVKNSLLLGKYWSLCINILGNVAMFAPFGFLGWVDRKYDNLKYLMTNFLSAIIIVEVLQYFSRLGVFDIDDILLNSLGVFLGFQIYKKLKYL